MSMINCLIELLAYVVFDRFVFLGSLDNWLSKFVFLRNLYISESLFIVVHRYFSL